MSLAEGLQGTVGCAAPSTGAVVGLEAAVQSLCRLRQDERAISDAETWPGMSSR